MAKIISIHSFRGGTGKSNIVANIAAVLARAGKRVGVIDTDIQSPGIHVIFGFNAEKMTHSLDDYLWGLCEIQETCYDVASALGAGVKGRVYLIPSSIKPNDITRILKEGYDVTRLHDGLQTLTKALNLDALLVDTHPGLNEETLLSIAIADKLVVLLRPDQQDYQGTGVTVQVARKLKVPRLALLVNQVPAELMARMQQQVSETYGCEVVGVLPYSEEFLTLGSAGIFAAQRPEHPISLALEQIADKLIG